MIFLYNDNENKDQTIKDLNEHYEIAIKNSEIFFKILNILNKNNDMLYRKNRKNILKLKLQYDVVDKSAFSTYISVSLLHALNKPIKDIKSDDVEKYDDVNLNTRHDITNHIGLIINKLIILYYHKFKDNIKVDKLEIENYVLKIIEILDREKIIESKMFSLYDKRKRIKKTYYYVYIEKFVSFFYIELYKTKFNVIRLNSKLYSINNTLYSIQDISRENILSGKHFVYNEIDRLKKLMNVCVCIDKTLLLHNLKLFCEEFCVNINQIEEDYYNTSIRLKEHIKNEDYDAISVVSKRLSILNKALIFKKIIDDESILYYLPFMFDFRGRIYKLSSISPTFFKEIRYCMYFNNDSYDDNANINNEIIDMENMINDIIKSKFYYINNIKNFINLNNISDKHKISVIWILISIGECFKSSLGSEVIIDKFIEKGIEICNDIESLKNLNYSNKLKIIYFIKILEEFNNYKFINRLISKDATASVFQHLLKILGSKNDMSYKYCNLDSSDTWYDTYQILINDWKDNSKEFLNRLKLDNFDYYFNRNTLKNTIMTQNYGAGTKKCIDTFFKKNNISKSDSNYSKIVNVILSFYNYISKDNIILGDNTDLIITYYKDKSKEIHTRDLGISNISYYLLKKKRIDSTLKGVRYSQSYSILTDKEDLEKYETSAKANYTHIQDACFAREIIYWMRTIAIHDSFAVSHNDITRLIATANYAMNLNFHSIKDIKHKKLFSIFILL